MLALRLCDDAEVEFRRGIQAASCVGPGKSNLPFELRRKAGDCSRVMGAHQLVAVIPINLTNGLLPDLRERAAFQNVQVLPTDLLCAADGISHTTYSERPEIGGLSAAARIKGGAIQNDGVVGLINGGNHRLEFGEVAVGLVK